MCEWTNECGTHSTRAKIYKMPFHRRFKFMIGYHRGDTFSRPPIEPNSLIYTVTLCTEQTKRCSIYDAMLKSIPHHMKRVDTPKRLKRRKPARNGIQFQLKWLSVVEKSEPRSIEVYSIRIGK